MTVRGVLGRLIVCAPLALTATGEAAANGWAGFYTASPERAAPEAPSRDAPSARRPSASAPGADGAPEGVCIRAILEAQARHGIPDNILLGIGLQEAGVMRNGELTVWPYAVNSEGKGMLFDSAAEALAFVGSEQARGARSIDVGCMQINLRWHPEAFITDAQGFWPEHNTDYAARFLRGLYEETGDWTRAVGAYHSRTPEHQARYLASAKRNIAVANQRIEIFRALAALPAGGTPAGRAAREMQTAQLDEPAAPQPERAGGRFWSTRASGSGPRRTLYGSGVIQPILPNFVR